MVAWPFMEAAPEPSLRTPRRPLVSAASVLAVLVGTTTYSFALLRHVNEACDAVRIAEQWYPLHWPAS